MPRKKIMTRLEDITDGVLSYNPEANIDLIWKAYVYSAKVHRGQVRASGEPYLSHPMEVAYQLTLLKMDTVSIMVGLLHDTLEDTYSTPEELRELFGEEVLMLVDGLTKISKIEFSSEEEKQAENYRKMILAMSKDIRVIIIKLTDRLHNMRTLQYMKPEKQKRIAKETLDIYAPISNRLGIGWIKQELEDTSFKYIRPAEYNKIKLSVDLHYDERISYINQVVGRVKEELEKSTIKASVEGRPKHFLSIYKKMKRRDISFDQVYDLLGIRVLSQSVKDCYSALGTIHAVWKPIPGKIKDYIAMPKANMYQSLHTTVIGPKGHRVEFQIRTEEMHNVAEDGIAAHWKYKEQKKSDDKGNTGKPDERFVWLRQMMEMQSELKNPKEFIETMRIDLFQDEVYVFTPAGEVKGFPRGATPLDFAYSIHTEIGHRCSGAKVNGKIVPLRYQLQNGDFVEIMTSQSSRPKREWLKLVKVSRAKAKIRQFLKEEQKSRGIALGRELIEKDIKKLHLSPDEYLKPSQLSDVAKKLDFSTADNMLAAIGFGKLSLVHFIQKLIPKEILEETKKKSSSAKKGTSALPPNKTGGEALRIRGMEDIMIRFARCCSPVPGDNIVGFISKARGVTVHTIDCTNVTDLSYDADRKIEVEWDTKDKSLHRVELFVATINKPGMLSHISNAIAENEVNINEVMTLRREEEGDTIIAFSLEVSNISKLEKVLTSIEKVDGVTQVERVKGLNRLKKASLKKRKK